MKRRSRPSVYPPQIFCSCRQPMPCATYQQTRLHLVAMVCLVCNRLIPEPW